MSERCPVCGKDAHECIYYARILPPKKRDATQ